MTCAVSAAVREGAQAVICASTGNTAASAAAYAAKAGPARRRDRPRRQDRDRQARPGARPRGARDRAARQLRHRARAGPRARRRATRSRSSTRSTSSASQGQKTASFELLEDLDGRIDALCIPVGNAGNITAYWKGFVEAGAAPRLFGFQAEGAAPLVHGRRGRGPRDDRERDPDRQPGALGGGDRRDDAPRAARSAPSPTRRSSRAYRLLAASEGVFCEPASAASVAGLLKYGADGARGDRLRAHRPRAQGSGHRARAGRRRSCRASRRCARSSARSWGERRWSTVRVPASSANLGPGFDCFAAALDLHLRARASSAAERVRARHRPRRAARPLEPRGRGVRAGRARRRAGAS